MLFSSAVCALIFFMLSTTIAQNSASPTVAPPTTASVAVFDEAGYRKFDETLQFFRARSEKEYAINSAKGIEESKYIPIGSIEQWVTIRGQDRTNPVLLFLHGGPGDVTTPWSLPYFVEWEEHFTVVQWDQRGAGKTFEKSGPSVAPTMTLDRMTQDGIELTEYLCKRLAKHKVILVAHSFGTILGLRMIQKRPDLFSAYVGTGQVADETANYAVAYGALIAKARETGNQPALEELKSVGPPPYSSSKGYQVQRRWSNRFEGADRYLPGTIGLALEAPKDSVQDLNATLAGELFSADHLVPQTRSATMKELGIDFKVPIFFFEGTEDFSTPTQLARKYFEAIRAPKKEYVPIPGGHFAVFMNSEGFLKQLVMVVLPVAMKPD